MVVESKRFLDLPLTMSGQMRTPSRFMKLSPGVAPSNTWTRSVSGGGGFQDQTYYDGIALSRGDQSQDDEVTPSVEAIQDSGVWPRGEEEADVLRQILAIRDDRADGRVGGP